MSKSKHTSEFRAMAELLQLFRMLNLYCVHMIKFIVYFKRMYGQNGKVDIRFCRH